MYLAERIGTCDIKKIKEILSSMPLKELLELKKEFREELKQAIAGIRFFYGHELKESKTSVLDLLQSLKDDLLKEIRNLKDDVNIEINSQNKENFKSGFLQGQIVAKRQSIEETDKIIVLLKKAA